MKERQTKQIKGKDVTDEFSNSIISFADDFDLALKENFKLSELDRLIKEKDNKLLDDIDILNKLSFGIRTGNLKIIVEN